MSLATNSYQKGKRPARYYIKNEPYYWKDQCTSSTLSYSTRTWAHGPPSSHSYHHCRVHTIPCVVFISCTLSTGRRRCACAVFTSRLLRTSGEVPVGLFSINTTFAKNEARPRPGQTRPLPGTRAQGDSVIHKLHRYEVHTRMSDHPRQGRTTTYDEPRTGQCNLQRTCARNDAAGG